MKSRNFNLVVLLVLLVMTAVIVSSQARSRKLAERAPGDSSRITSQEYLPLVANGTLPESDGLMPVSLYLGIMYGPHGYKLDLDTLVHFDREGDTVIPLANPQTSQLSGLAIDQRRNRLVVSSYGDGGYLDFYDLKKHAWTDSVPLQGTNVQGIIFWNGQLCGVERSKRKGTVEALRYFDANGNFVRRLKLSYTVIAPSPCLMVENGDLILYSRASPKLRYTIDHQNGEVSGDLRQEYRGIPASLIAVYKASGATAAHDTLDVAVEPTAPPTLVLSAYEDIHWRIKGGKHLQRVFVNAPKKPKISGLPSSCHVTPLNTETPSDYRSSPYEIQSHEMCLLLSKLEDQGIGVKSIAAGYQATTAIVR